MRTNEKGEQVYAHTELSDDALFAWHFLHAERQAQEIREKYGANANVLDPKYRSEFPGPLRFPALFEAQFHRSLLSREGQRFFLDHYRKGLQELADLLLVGDLKPDEALGFYRPSVVRFDLVAEGRFEWKPG